MAGMLGFAGLGVSGFALISAIVAVALDYWVYASSNGYERYDGLWNACSVILSNKDCVSIPGYMELNTVRAGVILALLLDVGACVCGALKLFMMKEKKMLGYVASGLLVAAGLFLIIAFGVYVSKVFEVYKLQTLVYAQLEYDLHAGFAFCIIAWLASWAGAALFGVATMQEQN